MRPKCQEHGDFFVVSLDPNNAEERPQPPGMTHRCAACGCQLRETPEAQAPKVDQVRRIEFRYLDFDLGAALTARRTVIGAKPRRMSFFLTTRQVLAHEKTVTRRNVSTWTRLQAGDRILAIEKGQGLKAGEGHHVLALLEVVSVRVEPLDDITAEDCAREGFPELTPAEFCAFYRRQA